MSYLMHPDLAVALIRVALGVFFFGSGLHKVFVKEVHERIVGLFKKLGCYNKFTEWAVPWGEMMGGLALIMGLLTPIAAFGLIIILMGAIFMVCVKEVADKHPRDWLDWIVKYIYEPEILMVILLAALIIAGDDKYSLNHWLRVTFL